MNRRAFTIVELAIVIMVIGILLMIAVPQFIRSRSYSQSRTCISSLKKLSEAKEQWGIAMSRPAGAACQMADLVPDFIKRLPECPTSGKYSIGTLDEQPLCSLGNLA
jgi:prepilin-type N-terminal cleavage/methylation domain-containing protein